MLTPRQQPRQQQVPGGLCRKVQCGLQALGGPGTDGITQIGKAPAGCVGQVSTAFVQDVPGTLGQFAGQLVRKHRRRHGQQKYYCK